jgi:site-specific recombinase XerD
LIALADVVRRRRCRGFMRGARRATKGYRYPADPPNVEEIIAVMRAAGDGAHGLRLRGLIVVLWRAGLRIQEALVLGEADLDQRRG